MPDRHSHGRNYMSPEPHQELSGGEPAPKRPARRPTRAELALVKGQPLSPESAALHKVLCREAAAYEGGGECDARASLFLRWAADKTGLAEKAKAEGDLDMFRKLTESARMDILYAREHVIKAARARREAQRPEDPLAAIRAQLGEMDPK